MEEGNLYRCSSQERETGVGQEKQLKTGKKKTGERKTTTCAGKKERNTFGFGTPRDGSDDLGLPIKKPRARLLAKKARNKENAGGERMVLLRLLQGTGEPSRQRRQVATESNSTWDGGAVPNFKWGKEGLFPRGRM